MTKLCKSFLPSDWIETTWMSLLGMQMSKNICFWDFSQDVRALNIILRGTPSHLNESMLHNQLEAGLESLLQAECICEDLSMITSLKEWIEHMKKADEHLIFTEESNL